MRLKRLQIFGFKTFADRTDLTLDGNIISVVGPNGCGKSNLVDAVLWALGEGTARQLRASSAQDVIFSGSSKQNPLGFAEVQLTFDNEDSSLPLPFAEICVSRRMNRTGESTYKINQTHCRLKDVHELLADSGIGRSGYSIVGQRDIDAALSAGTAERRAWIDEAAGVQRFRAKKQESERRLTQASEHLERLRDLIHELAAQQDELREEAEVARKFKSIQQAAKGMEMSSLAWDVANSIRQVATSEARLNDARKGLESTELEVVNAERFTETTATELNHIEAELERVTEERHKSSTAKERLDGEIKLLRQRAGAIKEQLNLFEQDVAASALRIEEARQECEDAAVRAGAAQAALASLEASLAAGDGQAAELTKKLKDSEASLASARLSVAKFEREMAEANQRAERMTLLKREFKGAEMSLPALKREVEEAMEHRRKSEDRLRALEEERIEIDSRIASNDVAIVRMSERIRDSVSKMAAMEGTISGLEATLESFEGLSAGARALIEGSKLGEFGFSVLVVGHSYRAPRGLSAAIEAALDSATNDVIVDGFSQATEALSWLTEHHAGKVTVWPLDEVSKAGPRPRLRETLKFPELIGEAVDLVKFDDRYRPVFEVLLRDVYVIESMEAAGAIPRDAGWRKLVSRNGEVVHADRSITGGSSKSQRSSFVQRKIQLEEAKESLDRMAKDLEVLEVDLVEIKSRQEREFSMRTDNVVAMGDAHKQIREETSLADALEREMKEALRDRDRYQAELTRLAEFAPPAKPETEVAHAEVRRDELLRLLADKSANADSAKREIRAAQSTVEVTELALEQAQKRLQHMIRIDEARKQKSLVLEPETERIKAEATSAEVRFDLAARALAELEDSFRGLHEKRRELLERGTELRERTKVVRDRWAAATAEVNQSQMEFAKWEAKRTVCSQRLLEDFGMTSADAERLDAQEPSKESHIELARLKREIKEMGEVNLGAIESFDRLETRLAELRSQSADVEQSLFQVRQGIVDLDQLTVDRFVATFERVRTAFAEKFVEMFDGGSASMVLADASNPLESGVDIEVTLPGKRRQPLSLLSGGERALSAAAFLFALLEVKPSPLVILDELDAPLDANNVERFVDQLRKLSGKMQFMVVTHNPTTIKVADVWLGISMQEPGITTALQIEARQLQLA